MFKIARQKLPTYACLMKQSFLTYVAIIAVFVTSIVLVEWLPDSNLIQTYAAIPLVGSLVAALFQILRDQATHDRELAKLDAQNRFTLGASSHMANVAFDKHVMFSEEYVAEVHKVLVTLFREGPTSRVFDHTRELYAIQQRYAVWLTQKIEQDLELFESSLRRLGATAYLVDVETGAKEHPQRIAEMYKIFANLMGEDIMGGQWDEVPLSEGLAISMVIRRLRIVLGTEELTEMRVGLVSKALASLRNG